MANRILEVIISGNASGLIASCGQASAALARVGASAKAAADESSAAADKTTASSGKMAANFKKFGAASALVLVGIGVASVNAAATFEQSMTKVNTQAGASTGEVKRLSGEVLKLAPKVGVGPDQLALSLYHVESAGFRANTAMQMVTASAKLSAIGGTDIESATQAIIATMASKIKGVKDANDAVALLNTTVGIGDMKMGQLTKALATGILPTAESVGLSFEDVSASLATITDNATPAEQVATRLKTALLTLIKPSQQQADAFGQIGMGSLDLANDFRKPDGLNVAVQDLKKHLEATYPAGQTTKLTIDQLNKATTAYYGQLVSQGENTKDATKDSEAYRKSIEKGGSAAVLASSTLARALGGSKTAGIFLTLIDESDRLNTKYKQLGDAGERARKLQEAWANQQKTFKQKVADLRAAVEVFAIKIGNFLLPPLKAVIGFLSDHQGVLAAIAITIGTVLVAATVAWTAALLANPVTWWTLGLVAIGAAIYELVTHFKEVVHFLQGPWGQAITLAIAIMFPLIGLPLLIAEHWKDLEQAALSLYHNGIKPAYDWIIKAGKDVGNAAIWLWKNALLPAWHGIAAAVDVAWGLIHPILDIFGNMFQEAGLIIEATWIYVISPVLGWIGQNFVKAWGFVQAGWNNVGLPVMNAIGDVFGWIWKQVLIPFFDFFKKGWGDAEIVFGKVGVFFLDVAQQMVKFFKSIGDAFLGLVHGLLAAAGQIPIIGGPFKKAAGHVSDFKKSFDKDMNGAVTTMDSAKNGINRAIDGINKGPIHISIKADGSFDENNPNSTAPLTSQFLAPGQVQLNPALPVATGGFIKGAGTGTSDSIAANLSNGEFVVNAKSTSKHLGTLTAINNDKAKGFAAGGLAGFDGNIPPFADLQRTGAEKLLANDWKSQAKKLMAQAQSYSGSVSGGVAQWVPLIIQVMEMLGLPMSLLGRVENQMSLESSGNPNAINLSDTNAQKGDPSKGLMQTVSETFAAYAGPYAGLGIYNPLANIYAGLNYAMHRYSGDPNIGLGYGHGYSAGTSSASSGWHLVGERGPEWMNMHGGETVLPNGTNPGGLTVVIHVAGSVVTEKQLVKTVQDGIYADLKRKGKPTTYIK